MSKAVQVSSKRIEALSRGTLEYADLGEGISMDEVEELPGGHFRSQDGKRWYVRRGDRLYRMSSPGPYSFGFAGEFEEYRGAK
jgi:hypothetical protein